MERCNPYCLVLSGGGAKGIYHIGVWKALRELNIKIDSFIGNSIGAIIAAFLVQGDETRLNKIGDKIGINYIIDVPDDLIEDGEFKLKPGKIKAFRNFYKKSFSDMALDTTPLKNLLHENLDEDKVRRKGKDFGVVSFNLTDMKPAEIFIEDMEHGELVNYVLASSAFPGFEQPKIAGKKYIDGGVFDNIPYSMARKRGYKNIIVVDISGIGMKRKLEIEGCETVYIKNSINMGGVLNFNKKFLSQYRELGYLDTLKTFEKLKGYNYFIKPDLSFEKTFISFLEEDEIKYSFIQYVEDLYSHNINSFTKALKHIFPKHSKYNRDYLAVFADSAASVMSLERIKAWTYQELFSEMNKKYKVLNEMADELSDLSPKKIKSLIKQEHKEVDAIKTPFYYFILVDKYLSGKSKKVLVKMLFELFTELSAGAFFIKYLNNFWQK